MTTSAELIILNLTKARDNSVVIHTLSREFGRRSFIVSVKKGSSMALFLPLNIIDAEIVENSKSQLWRVRNITSSIPLMRIRGDIHKNAMTMFLSEVLYRSLCEGLYADSLYDWCRKSILDLDALECGYSEFNTRFLVELCIALGFAPSSEGLEPFIQPTDKDNLDALLRYLSYHLDCALNIKSLEVLRELYA